jgi:diaminohydroxyphosphoribosylaminopyrimidine deaminase/5-amino-6-(5-phosphoribosylamino)uracil reductase
MLTDAGIDVTVGVEVEEVVAADPAYFHHRRTGRPFVTLKLASTLDGQAAAVDGTSQWITGEEARTDAHRLRSQHDAILVGSGTLLADDPALTVRLDGYDGPQPLPLIVKGRRDLPEGSQILSRDHMVYGDGVEPVDVALLLKDAGTRGILSILVEGGPSIAESFLRAELVDRVVWYIGAKVGVGTGQPAIAGTFRTIADAVELSIDDVERLGPDVRIRATIVRPQHSASAGGL